MKLWDKIADYLIERSKRTPFKHIYHADGSLYMERFWLFRTRFFSARIHHIATGDYDRHMHDHPWSFISVVLRGSYVEKRPMYRWPWMNPPQFNEIGEEINCTWRWRLAGSVARRLFCDRHLISYVTMDTWTLFIMGPKRQSWGFYTPDGYVNRRQYYKDNGYPLPEVE